MSSYRRLTPNEPPVAILDGAALDDGGVIVISAIWGLEDELQRPTRLLYIDRDNNVSFMDVPENIVSVAHIPDGSNSVLGLAKSGNALIVYPEMGPSEPMRRRGASRLISLFANSDEQFACGLNGQIYQRHEGHWQPFDDGVFDPITSLDSVQWRGLGGHSRGVLIAAGLFGAVAEFDGQRWHRVDVATNCSFEQIAHLDRAFWICGDKGTLLRKESDEWEIVDTGAGVNFWSIRTFKGKLYLSAFEGVWLYDTQLRSITPVDFQLGFTPDTYKMSTSNERLWSFGQNSILYFDGDSWNRATIPCNA